MVYESIQELVQTCKNSQKKARMAVVSAADPHCLEAVRLAVAEGIVTPILIGPAPAIETELQAQGGMGGTYKIENLTDVDDMAQRAVDLVKQGAADFIMKGLINSTNLLKPIVRKAGLNIGNSISHVSLIELPAYHKLVALTDCAMNIQPELDQKIAIVKNAVGMMKKLGYTTPKVAMLCANEEPTPKQQDTMDAREIQELAERGALGDCMVCGPISFDLAMDAKAAEYKGFDSPVAGDADILVVPNLVTGNVLNKALKQFGHSVACGAVVGAKCPVVLTSRTSSTKNKYLSIVLCAAMS